MYHFHETEINIPKCCWSLRLGLSWEVLSLFIYIYIYIYILLGRNVRPTHNGIRVPSLKGNLLFQFSTEGHFPRLVSRLQLGYMVGLSPGIPGWKTEGTSQVFRCSHARDFATVVEFT
jgi:hypothetical protein